MSREYSEDGLVEAATQDVLEELGWEVKTAWHNERFGENGLLGRDNKSEAILKRYLLSALKSLNKDLPETAYKQAIEQISQKVADKTLAQINQEKYSLLKNGVSVKFTNDKGELIEKKLKVFDFSNYENNNFLAVRQLEIVSEYYNRRPDIIGFVNGLPLVFFELKAHHTDLRDAYIKNINDYKDTISQVFHCNAFIILSNGTDAKVGTVTSPYKFFLEWKRITEDEEGIVSLDTMLRGTCSKRNLMDIFENFLLFDNSGGDIVKIMSKNHQFLGVNKVIEQAKNIEELKGKLGVFWHTQGSGKSYSIVFISQKIHRKFGGSYTFLIVADRTELERQLYDTFTGVGVVSSNDKVVAQSRDNLRDLLKENHRYIFTLIHKFSIDKNKEVEYPLITDRKNIIVISDEAHRTQDGTFAKNMRFHGIPNASYLGFTGTPIIKEEEAITRNIFGEYVSVYDFKKSIIDGATLPLKYLNRGEKLDIDNPDLDEKMAKVIQNEDLEDDQRKKLANQFKKEYAILTSNKRLNSIAKDLVWHFNERGYQGKAMLVTLDKPTAVKMYDFIMKHWKDYEKDLEKRIKNADDTQEELNLKRKFLKVKETEVCVIVSPEQNEVSKFRDLELDILPHRKKMVDRNLEKEFKDENNPFRLAIVCAMWITGFDVPCISTVYLDKPIQGHTLMQTIARANRVYDDQKENGLIVDYGNVYQQLKDAYKIYGEGNKEDQSKNDNEKEDNTKPFELLKSLEHEFSNSIDKVQDFLNELGFNLSELVEAKPMQKLEKISKAKNCINLNDNTRARFELLAGDVFRKYMALYPEEEIKPYISLYNAIEAIFDSLNQKRQTADISSIIKELQELVNDSISIIPREESESPVEIDISNLNFEKLKTAFEKSDKKNQIVFDLHKVVENKLNRMLRENPLRLEFYEKYQKIIKQYNQGKSLEDTIRAFENLNDFINNLTVEETRAMRENLDEETLAIFDLLLKENLSDLEKEEVKKVAKKTLENLKSEKLKIERWRESSQITSQVWTTIFDSLAWLPQQSYTDNDVNDKTSKVYQHIYSSYPGGDYSAYNMFHS